MKKSILIGALALFAIGAMSIQSAEAQNPVKKQGTKTEIKKAETVKADDTKQAASDDCCAAGSHSKCSKKKLSTATASGDKSKSEVKHKHKKGEKKIAQKESTDK